ncbi:MAG: hypothetical protein GFH27_549283n322 [Chloroflexi bacterium AL-W]|nr:hypothetical protein [Chloroflexi bacterium AL-N1]NOK64556.1 hypothetical protein [Chloroflexi bacterium AL-N10]NOK75798.1 hypothetical protein [Chloroflexi bacterium AL-N5]NOK80443.1 hypothetical protein [Chloroflexi bacterium AL-W]NOK86957.1 hypothetical protein [Chloroflexi bacterium AL-N15]
MISDTTQTPVYKGQPFRSFMTSFGVVVAAGLLWIASGLLIPASLLGLSGQLQGLVTIFLGIFIEALPFLLAGVLAASAIHLFVSPEQVQRLCPRAPIPAAFTGALLGLVFPVCECGSIPTARRLIAKGAPLPMGIAFVLAAPVVNPVVIASTWVAFSIRPEIVLARVGLTILIACAVGIILGMHRRPQELLSSHFDDQHAYTDHDHDQCAHDHHHDHDHQEQGTFRRLLAHASSEFFEMGRYLVIGALIAATLQTLIPRETLLGLGEGPIISVLVLMALAVILSICSTVDAFVALAFVNSFSIGSVLAFLVFGPMIDIKSVLMLRSTFSRRAVIAIVLLTFQMSFLVAILINLYL